MILLVQAGGYFGIFTAGCAFYTATAELTNEVYRKVRSRTCVRCFAPCSMLSSFMAHPH